MKRGVSKEIKEALAEFEGFDPADFDLDAKIDQRLMVQMAKSMLRGFEKLRHHLRDPGVYSQECLRGIFLLLIREFAPLKERLESVLGRLKATPQVLAQGIENINSEEVPPVWCKVALESAQQGLGLFTMLIPALGGAGPGTASGTERGEQGGGRGAARLGELPARAGRSPGQG